MKPFIYFAPAVICIITLAATALTQLSSPSLSPSEQSSGNKSNVGADGTARLPMSSEDRKEVINQIDEKYSDFKFNEHLFGLLFYFCVVAAVVTSAASALILKLKKLEEKSYTLDTAACLSCIASILITLNVSVGFNAMWRSNRFARIELEALRIECRKSSFGKDQALEKLGEIIKNQHKIQN
jgi:hypothetical protein